SNDGGVSWNYKVVDPQDTEVQIFNFGKDTAVLPVDVFRGISFTDSLNGVVLRSYSDDTPTIYWWVDFSSDGGFTRHPVPMPIDNPLYAIQCIDPTHTTVVGNGGYISHSKDGGITMNEQVSNTVNNLYGVGFGTVQAGNAVGIRGNIMRITTDENPPAAVKENPTQEPKIIIEGNYPNPFNGSTTITYHLPSSGFTTAEIFTIEGKHLTTLANEFQSSGEHSLIFDAAGFASGTYFVRVSSGGQSESGEIIVKH
ncbi:MAG: T9SS type A sorting domain-containing protein, partial [Candidatus Kapaibacterium sp.]